MVYDADLLTGEGYQDGTGATGNLGGSVGVPEEGGAPGSGGVAPGGGTSNGGTGPSGGSGATVAGAGTTSGGTASGGTTTSEGGSAPRGGGSAGEPAVVGGQGPGGSPDMPTGGAGGEAGSGGCPNGDCCPTDPLKTEEGECGCNMPDDDSDSDGTANCNDQCPDSPQKTDPGECGCDILDDDAVGEAGCLGLKAALVHRYSFDGAGSVAADSAGSADGTVVGTTLGGSGRLALTGGMSDQYVDLPNGLLSSLTDATIEIWLEWDGGNGWQRIFDFGSSSAGEDAQENGVTYLFVTPQNSTTDLIRVAFSTDGNANETSADAAISLPIGVETHLAVVVDDTNNLLSLYLDGAVSGAPVAFSGHLSGLMDVNNWIGRSQFQQDDELGGAVDELRIYDAALTDEQIALSASSGPDPIFLP